MNRDRVKAVTLAAMCFALFMANLDDTVMNLALPKIQISLNSGVSGLQWILNSYTLRLFLASLTYALTEGHAGRDRRSLSRC